MWVGGIQQVRDLLQQGAYLHYENDDKALIGAGSNGYINLVRLLLTLGADVHARNDETLRQAAQFGNAEIVEI